ERPLDFTVIVHVHDALDWPALTAGARSAQHLYATSGSTTDGRRWIRAAPADAVAITAGRLERDRLTLEEFVDGRIDLRVDPPVRQQLTVTAAGSTLATRFHHAAADGPSAAIWLAHQLHV